MLSFSTSYLLPFVKQKTYNYKGKSSDLGDNSKNFYFT